MNSYPVKTPGQLGAVLQGYRKARELTQAQAGASVGLAQKEISKLESDPSRSSLLRVFKLLAALNLELVVRERGSAVGHSKW
jgi:HTH-type transcriptional regulator/antitoxin HipB